MSGRGIEVIQPIINTLREGEVEIKFLGVTIILRSKGKERDKEEGKDIGKQSS